MRISGNVADTFSSKSKRKEENLWRYLLANDPQKLIAKYPDLGYEFQETHCFANSDAQLTKLKTESLNGQPVIIRARSKSTHRLAVKFHDHSASPREMTVKGENLSYMTPLPASDAFSIFKSNVSSDLWTRLTVKDSCFKNENIIRSFVGQQMPYFDETVQKNRKCSTLCRDVTKLAKDAGVAVSVEGCPKILSLLYTLSFHRQIHIIRIFNIPSNWALQPWFGNQSLHVPLPQSTDSFNELT